MQMKVIILKRILLIGDRAPVEAFTLLLPYPPNAGRAIKQPPTTFETPSATISLLALTPIPLTPSLRPSPRPLAATDDSKNPRSAMLNEVLIAVRKCFMWLNGHSNAKTPLPLSFMGPRIPNPLASQPNFHVNTAEKITTRNRSGK